MYRLLIRPAAEKNFEDLYEYIRQHSPRGADAWADAFHAALKDLESNPLTFPLAPEDEDHDAEIRQLLFKTRKGRMYRALFTVREQVAFLLHVRGPGQDDINSDDLDLPE